jgi:hypothetical protein
MNRYNVGDIVYCKRMDIENAVIVGVEMVSSNPKVNAKYTLDEYIKRCDTYQYTLVFYDSEIGDTLKDTLYESYLND